MVRHDYRFVQPQKGKPLGQCQPGRMDHLASVVQAHFAIDDLPKKAQTALSADGDEIRAFPRIIVPLQA